MCPCRAFYEWFCCFFFAGDVGSLKTQISQKIQKPEYLAKNKKNKNKNTFAKGSAGAHYTLVQKIQGVISQTRRGHLDSEGIWGYVLEPACTRSYLQARPAETFLQGSAVCVANCNLSSRPRPTRPQNENPSPNPKSLTSRLWGARGRHGQSLGSAACFDGVLPK